MYFFYILVREKSGLKNCSMIKLVGKGSQLCEMTDSLSHTPFTYLGQEKETIKSQEVETKNKTVVCDKDENK
jgi:hypothetical protein